MKKTLRFLVLLFVLCLGAALAACGEETLCLLTVTFDAEKGAVSTEPVRDSLYYEKDEEVTVRVTPFEGYKVESFEVGGKAQELVGSEYKFKIAEDTEITVTFAAVETDGGDDAPALSFPQAYRGTWKTFGTSSSRTDTLEINGYSLKLTDSHLNAQSLEISANAGGGYAIKWGERNCVLKAVAGAEYVLVLEEGTDYTCFLKEGEREVEVPAFVRGDYLKGADTLTVGDAVTLNGEEATLVGGGEDFLYALCGGLLRLDFAEDTVTVTPYLGASAVYTKDTGPDFGVTFTPYWVGLWTSLDGETELTVTTRSLTLGGEPPTAVEATASGYSFELGGTHYEASFCGVIPGVVLELRAGSAAPYTYEYFAVSRHPVFGEGDTIEAGYYRSGASMEWYRTDGGSEKLVIGPHSVQYGGESPDYIVPTGHIETYTDEASGWPITVGAECYYLFFGDEMVFLSWYPDDSTPILDFDGIRVDFYDGIIHLPADWRGTWNSLTDGSVMTVEEGSVRFGTTDGQLKREGDYTVLWKGERYALHAYNSLFEHGGEELIAMLYLEEITEDIEHLPVRYYFLNAVLSEEHVVLDSVLNGTWKSETEGDFVVESGVPTWGERRIVVLSETHDEGSLVYSYVLVIDGEVSSLDFYGGIGIRVTVGFGTDVVFLKHGAIDKTSEGAIPKEARGIYYDGITRAIVVEKEGITVYDGTGEHRYAVGDTASATIVRVDASAGSVALYFVVETVDTGGGDIGAMSQGILPAAAGDVTRTQVRVTLAGNTAEWSEYGTQDDVPDYYPQDTLTKSTLF